MRNKVKMPDYTYSNPGLKIGMVVEDLLKRGIRMEQFQIKVANNPLSGISEVCAQSPEPGTALSELSKVVLTVNPGSVTGIDLSVLLERLLSALSLRSCQYSAVEQMVELIARINEVNATKLSQRYSGDANLKELLSDIESCAGKETLNIETFRALLTQNQEIIRLFTDNEFVNLLESDFARIEHHYQEGRLSFFMNENLLFTESSFSSDEKEQFDLFKQTTVLKIGAFDTLRDISFSELTSMFLKKTLKMGLFGITDTDLAEHFTPFQIEQLLRELQKRTCSPFTLDSFIEKIVRYLGIRDSEILMTREADKIWLCLGDNLNDKQLTQAKILQDLFVPIFCQLVLRAGNPYWILDEKGFCSLENIILN